MLRTLTGEQYSTNNLFFLLLQRPVHMYPFSFENSKVSFCFCQSKLNGNVSKRYPKWKTITCGHGPILHGLQKTESGCIVPSQKNSGNRSSTMANNEIANNNSIRAKRIHKFGLSVAELSAMVEKL